MGPSGNALFACFVFLATFVFVCFSNSTPTDNPKLAVVLQQEFNPPKTDRIVATMVHLTFPPGDVGTKPHTHPGPVVGYVMDGEFLFQLAGAPVKVLKAGETFYENEGDIHVWGGNGSNNSTCKVVATLWAPPGQPILTFVENYQRGSREEALEEARKGITN